MKNIQAIASLDVNIDWTNPDTVIVFDGNPTDIDTFYTQNQIEANWSLSADTNSGISSYWYAIGDSYGDSNIVAWTNNGLNNSFSINPSLNIGTTYYISVRTENGAGLVSQNTSDGQLLMWPLSISQLENGNTVKVYPNPTKETVNIQISASQSKTINWSLINIEGKIIYQEDIHLLKGTSTISKDISNLAKGNYILKIDDSTHSTQHQIIIQ